PVQIPTSILRALKTGIFNPGKAITDDLFPGTLWLIHVLDAWLKLSDSERLVRANPWSWKEFVFGVPGPTYASQRNSLLYLVHPKTFAPIVSEKHKALMREAFMSEITERTGDIDRDLFAIILQLQRKTHGPVNFYDGVLSKRWMPSEGTLLAL
ncbi:hypothetical protein JF66_22615, partial [Cryobacterium sp. MLB-32]|uniref:hypothetical protein n=1 Tax=Cryobacterium sp. MLB-32 TaxID=1529318 RepID=UPI0004E638E7